MATGFLVLLIVGRIVGVGLLLLFPLFCIFMMVAMMLGMGHGHDDRKH
jgi:hypothetical protein